MRTDHPFPNHPVLVIDDDPAALRSICTALRVHGINHIEECSDSREVLPFLEQRPVEVILLDLTMPYLSGEELLGRISENHAEVPVIVITAMNEVATAVRCLQRGAFDYMVKPVEKNRLLSGVKRAIEIQSLRHQHTILKEHLLLGALRAPEVFSEIKTRNKKMLSIFQYLESIVPSQQPILVTGETGVGKELIVKAIHALINPKSPLVAINVAGLDDTVFTDTLFGHVKGAFTGATERRQGLVEKAACGVLHLDEIGDLNHSSQIKLLRLLQEGEYFPLGTDSAKKANTRVVATTNIDLAKMKESGQFRKDLYYRLSVHHVHIPPLRDRRDDIILLARHFIEKSVENLAREPIICSDEALTLMSCYDFPGNIRELQAIICDAVGRNTSGRFTARDFKGRIDRPVDLFPVPTQSGIPQVDMGWAGDMTGRLPTIAEANIILIKEALRRCNNNRTEAAQLLGITRQRLARNLK